MIPDDLRELHERQCAAFRKTKEAVTKNGEPVLNTTVAGFRGGDNVVVTQALPDRDLMMGSLSYVFKGFGCDQIVMAYETYHANTPVNPLTEEPWELGEMQYVFEHYPQAKTEGWIIDSLTITTIDKDANTLSSAWNFTQDDDVVTWGEEEHWTSEDPEAETTMARTGQAIQEVLTDMKGNVSTHLRDVVLQRAGANASMSRVIDKLDCALVVQMQHRFKDHIKVALLADPDSEREKLIRKTFSEDNITVFEVGGDIQVPAEETVEQ